MSLLRLKQLAQDGATTGQAPVWNGTTWVPSDPTQWWDDVLTATGGETLVTLGQTPLTRSERIWKRSSGVEVLLDRTTDYTISSNVITLLTALTAGQQIRSYYVYAAGLTGLAATLAVAGGSATSPAPYGLGAYSAASFGI